MSFDKKKKGAMNIDTLLYGKIPPQARSIEMAVIGVMMLEAGTIDDVRNMLKPEDFYVEANQILCENIFEMNATGRKVDSLTLSQYLADKGNLERVGGAYYVAKCTNDVVSGAHVADHCRLIKQYSIARKLIVFSGEVISEAYDGADPLLLVREAEQRFYEINAEIEQTRIVSKEEIAWRLTQQILVPKKLTEEERALKYLYTGMKEWDHINGPLFPGGVYTIAARPAMGKTAHAIQLIINLAKKVPVGLVNVEMTDEQLAKRIVSNLVEMNNLIFKKEVENWDDAEQRLFYSGLQQFLELQLHIESNITEIDTIIAKIKFWVRKFGVRVVVIDYLQILRVADELAKYMTDVQALNYILERIRACAKEMNITIFLLSQLNRELYRRAGNKEPNMGDLKGSGKIEEISFQISFLHRPEYYEADSPAPVDEYGESTKGLCYQIIAKHRDGTTGRVKHRFIPWYTKFEQWESDMPAWKPVQGDAKHDFPDDMPF